MVRTGSCSYLALPGLVLLTLPLSPPASAQSVCVESTYQITAGGSFQAIQGGNGNSAFQLGCDACEFKLVADHAIGAFSVQSTPAHYYDSALISVGNFADSYRLICSEAGTVPIDAVLTVDGYPLSCVCYFVNDPVEFLGLADVSLVQPGVDSRRVASNFGFAASELRITIAATPGQPFELVASLSASAPAYCCLGRTSTRASLRFERVPATDYIVSCKGYASGVVSTRQTSWGRIKQIYR